MHILEERLKGEKEKRKNAFWIYFTDEETLILHVTMSLVA